MARDFLLEIGVEELPHSFIEPARRQLEAKTAALCKEINAPHKEISSFCTPRRLAVLVRQVEEKQKDEELLKKGPPLKAAFAGGVVTKAGEGFCRGAGYPASGENELADFDQLPPGKKANGLYKKELGGQYFLFAYTFAPGRPTSDVLAEKIPGLITALEFPKTMRWSDLDFSFARPIRWLCCLWGKDIIGFELAGLTAGRGTSPHPWLATGKQTLEVKTPADYPELLRKNFVLADPQERRSAIEEQLAAIEKKEGLTVVEKGRVLELVTNLVEYPHLLVCEFDPAFLELPREVLISEMIGHQMYFPLEDKNGKLAGKFIVTSNITSEDYVRTGNLKVLTSRLRDGSFLYEEDLKKGLEKMGTGLSSVLYQKDLGSYGDKVERTGKVVTVLIDQLAGEGGAAAGTETGNTRLKGCDSGQLLKLCRLMKNDLTSAMVYEFPHLQGVMGSYYARAMGLSAEESLALKEHYYPLASGTAVPETSPGIILALAEKIENIMGGFAAGLAPTGGGDPYALRRQALGLVRILIEHRIFLDLPGLFASLGEGYAPIISRCGSFKDTAALCRGINDFLKNRIKTIFKDYQFTPDEIEAALCGEFHDIYKLYLVLQAVHAMRGEKVFAEFTTVLKRAKNIIGTGSLLEVDTGLICETASRELWQAFSAMKKKLLRYKENHDYGPLFREYAQLHPPLARFFDEVLVECEDNKLKNNREAILRGISSLVDDLLDFSRIIM